MPPITRRAPIWAVLLYEGLFIANIIHALQEALWTMVASVALVFGGLALFDNWLIHRPWAHPQPLTAIGGASGGLCLYFFLRWEELWSAETTLLMATVAIRICLKLPPKRDFAARLQSSKEGTTQR
jgi:hypothetical protein